jgi:hypothetical protein
VLFPHLCSSSIISLLDRVSTSVIPATTGPVIMCCVMMCYDSSVMMWLSWVELSWVELKILELMISIFCNLSICIVLFQEVPIHFTSIHFILFLSIKCSVLYTYNWFIISDSIRISYYIINKIYYWSSRKFKTMWIPLSKKIKMKKANTGNIEHISITGMKKTIQQ